jgi:hypothetical protein
MKNYPKPKLSFLKNAMSVDSKCDGVYSSAGWYANVSGHRVQLMSDHYGSTPGMSKFRARWHFQIRHRRSMVKDMRIRNAPAMNPPREPSFLGV